MKLTTLKEKMDALPATERRRIAKRVDELIAEEMTMRELRKARAHTQESLAEKLGVKQEQVSRMEKRTDLHISTFKHYIEAMGGELEMIAKFPDGAAVKITSFAEIKGEAEAGSKPLMNIELCSQGCNKPAVGKLNGQPLCVACLTQLQNTANEAERNRLIYLQQLLAHTDHLEDQMAASIGMPRLTPRMRLPQMPHHIVSTVNNTNIDRSTVGVINTGTVDSINVHLQELVQSGSHDAAEALKTLAEAVLQDRTLQTAEKNELLDQIAFLTEQAALKPEKRQKKAIILPIIEGLSKTASAATSLVGAWTAVHPILSSIFG